MNQVQEIATGNSRNSREHWLKAAYELLVNKGIDAVKIMPLAKSLGAARTGFYWHFEDRQDLLDALLAQWHDTNTVSIVAQANKPANTIAEAVLHIFDCWTETELFDERLDFAIRSWAINSAKVRALLDQNDAERLAAITGLFCRFGFESANADVRARTLYFTQIGYYALENRETFAERMERIADYIVVFTGKTASPEELTAFRNRHIG